MNDMPARVLRRMLAERSLVRLAVLTLAVLIVFSLVSSTYFTVINFQSMGFQVAEVGLLSLAVMLAMLTGGIDLSIISVANIAGIVTAQLFKSTGAATAEPGQAFGMTVGFILIGLFAGTVCGVLNGLLITRLRITPILATLGTLQLLNGIAIIWTGGQAVYGMPNVFLNIGIASIGLVPVPVLVLLTAAVGTAVFVNRTGMGLRLRLIGANPTAARYSGLNNDRVLMVTYVASAFLSSLAGIIIAARSASANADYGVSYLLLAIVIVVLGGVNPMGGYGTVTGVVLSAFVLQMVSSGFNMVGYSSFAYQIAQGAILIGVMSLSALARRYHVEGRSTLLNRWRRTEPSTAQPPEGKRDEEAHQPS
jgi:simple sugar transport system permease protein